MSEQNKNNFGYMFNRVVYDEDMISQFDEFTNEYTNKSDRELYAEIEKIQSEVDINVKKKHINNLEHLAQMEGFVSAETAQHIDRIKKLIKVDESSSSSKSVDERSFHAQFASRSSLLLWFLLVTALFRGRKRKFRRPIRRPFRPYPYY